MMGSVASMPRNPYGEQTIHRTCDMNYFEKYESSIRSESYVRTRLCIPSEIFGKLSKIFALDDVVLSENVNKIHGVENDSLGF